MRAVLQKVLQASVDVNNKQISKIQKGLCVLIGLSVNDTPADLDFMVKKLLSVKVFDTDSVPSSSSSAITPLISNKQQEERDDDDDDADDTASISSEGTTVIGNTESSNNKMWSRNVVDIQGEILCVSQFTLYGTVIKGSKPDFHLAMGSEKARVMYMDFLDRLKKAYRPDRIQDGEFGAMMIVNIANDGPVTLELDSRKFEYIKGGEPKGQGGKQSKQPKNLEAIEEAKQRKAAKAAKYLQTQQELKEKKEQEQKQE